MFWHVILFISYFDFINWNIIIDCFTLILLLIDLLLHLILITFGLFLCFIIFRGMILLLNFLLITVNIGFIFYLFLILLDWRFISFRRSMMLSINSSLDIVDRLISCFLFLDRFPRVIFCSFLELNFILEAFLILIHLFRFGLSITFLRRLA